MKIGLVCPYSFDVPGGVQSHVRDLAVELRGRGNDVEIFAPASTQPGIEGFHSAGSAVRVPYNGSVARLCFGPLARSRTRAWLAQGNFDVVHIHEPLIPSVSLLALAAAECPVVATFHLANELSYAYVASVPFLTRLSEKITARIAVSAEARRTLVTHHGGDAVIIPNGVAVADFAAEPRPAWQATPERPVFAFLGRLDEERKGLPILAGAIEAVLAACPGARFLIAGRGEVPDSLGLARYGDAVELLGPVSDEEKAQLLAGATAYIAPQTGGESFGIVLVEAMAAGTLTVASNIPAFAAVLDSGRAGRLFNPGDSGDLARVLIETLEHPDQRDDLAARGRSRSAMYDWGRVGDEIVAVYDTVATMNRAGGGELATGAVDEAEEQRA
ncbi:glycosyltransferase [Nanchangia anserum]|uniref:Glycosyltransferase family 4 protein n=1 Tax=Nanchangia anserum TaxID=2692125 RepID=A0A8I0KN01_9ACTO|nr:glycosyltransferase family 4 protein [Nanchangia anserum]